MESSKELSPSALLNDPSPPCARPAAIAFFSIAFLIAAFYAHHATPGCYKYLDEGPKIAAHIAEGHGFLNPIDPSPNSPPTSWLPPLYPFLMATVYRLFGVASHVSLNIMLGLNAVCFGLIVTAAYLLARRLFGPPAGITAGVLVLLYPTFLLRTVYFWDTHLALAVFAWLTIAAINIGQKPPTTLRLVLLGIGLALLALLNASYVLAFPLIVLIALRALPRPQMAVPICITLAAFAFTLTPWTIRNYHVFHQFFFVRGGVNLELWLGNRPGTTGWIELSQHPSVNRAEGNLMIRLGDLAYYKLCGERFHADRIADPNSFLRHTLNRAAYLLFGNPAGDATKLVQGGNLAGLLRVALDAVVLVAAVAGAVVAWKRRRLALWLLPLGLTAVAPFLVTHVTYRYSMPLRFVSLISASALVLLFPNRCKNSGERNSKLAEALPI